MSTPASVIGTSAKDCSNGRLSRGFVSVCMNDLPLLSESKEPCCLYESKFVCWQYRQQLMVVSKQLHARNTLIVSSAYIVLIRSRLSITFVDQIVISSKLCLWPPTHLVALELELRAWSSTCHMQTQRTFRKGSQSPNFGNTYTTNWRRCSKDSGHGCVFH